MLDAVLGAWVKLHQVLHPECPVWRGDRRETNVMSAFWKMAKVWTKGSKSWTKQGASAKVG